MTAYLTVRSRSHSRSGTLSGAHYQEWVLNSSLANPDPQPPGAYNVVNAYVVPDLQMTLGLGSGNQIVFRTYISSLTFAITTATSQAVIKTTTGTGSGGNVTWSNPSPVNTTSTFTIPGSISLDFSGTWSLTISAAKEASDFTQPGLVPPTYGGTSSNDLPYYTKEARSEWLDVGATITATFTTGSQSVTVTGTVTTAFQLDYGTSFTVNACDSMNTSGTVSFTGTTAGIALGQSVTETATGTNLSASYNAGPGLSVTTTSTARRVPPTTGSLVIASATIGATHYPDKPYTLSLILKDVMGGNYPDGMTVVVLKPDLSTALSNVVVSGGVGSASYSDTQTQYAVSGSLLGSGITGASVNTYGAIACYLQSAALAAAGEPSTQWRVLLRGYQWNAATISQAASKTVLSAYSISGVTTHSRTLSTANGLDSGLKGTSWANASLQFGACLRVRMKAGSSTTVGALKLGTKTWSSDWNGNPIALTTSYQDFDFDLCAPTNATATFDAKDSRFPLSGAGTQTVTDSDFWGVSNASALEFTGLNAGITYDVQSVQMVRKVGVKLSVRPAWLGYVDNNLSIDTTQNQIDCLFAETDGRKSLEAYFASRFDSTTLADQLSVLDVVGQVNGSAGALPADGWSMADTTPYPSIGSTGLFPALRDYFLCSNRPAHYLMGMGARYTKEGSETSPTWKFAFDLDASASLPLVGQVVMDTFSWFPGIGDAHSRVADAYGGTTQIVGAVLLRSQAAGYTLTMGYLRQAGVTVQVAGGVRGSGTSNAQGFYQTGTPYVQGSQTKVVSSGTVSGNVTFPGRKRMRVWLRVNAAGSNIAYDVSQWGRHARAFVQSGTLWLGTGQEAIPTSWVDVDSTIAGVEPRLRYERGIKSQRLFMVYRVGSNSIRGRYTQDEGTTWSAEMTIGTGTQPDFVDRSDGTKWFYWRNASGGIDYALYDTTLTLLLTGTTNITSGVDDDDIAVREFATYGGVVKIGLFYRTGGTLTYVTGDGFTFS